MHFIEQQQKEETILFKTQTKAWKKSQCIHCTKSNFIFVENFEFYSVKKKPNNLHI